MTMVENIISAAGLGLDSKLIEESDQAFLRELYGTTRAAELAVVPWTDKEKSDFIAMQFAAQHTFYTDQFKNAEFAIITKNNINIGRLYLDQRKDEIRIIDIAILPDYQKMGIGKALLQGVQTQAQELNLPITIHVEKSNPAMSLYKTLDFKFKEDQGVYNLMRWSAVGI